MDHRVKPGDDDFRWQQSTRLQPDLNEPDSEERVPFAAQVLPLVSTNQNDPCGSNRCVNLIFRTENGYLPVRAHIDLTRRTVAIQGGGRRR